ncbi:zinc-ribbon domain-containing protein [Pontivivens ytuae]|uniref:Zinc-ribbon domain-containing protein n=1 Tax=Pontivivens ytuae TaxID=2789856 RepID=A0A7S9QE55_9RHOB|nr:zinc-ribbon domain-containing protein [Pontivivens ytuae]QPH55042.1 zinc-ribbon domain-containing protein [Pontivivens ytuae]
MRLICPNCATQYEVPDSAIPARGRKVECGNCGNSWHVSPPEVVAEEAAQVVEPEQVVEETPPPAAEEPVVEAEAAPVAEETSGQPAFDANVLRELLARPVTKDEASEETAEAVEEAPQEDVEAPSFASEEVAETEDDAPRADDTEDAASDEAFEQQDDVAAVAQEEPSEELTAEASDDASEDAPRTPEGEDTTDGMSIPPVPQPESSVRQSADAAFEAMRARRAARRAARAAQREQEEAAASAEVEPQDDAPTEAETAESDPNVMADLRRLIDSDDAQPETTESENTVEEMPAAPRRPRRERPPRPGSEAATEAGDDDRVVPLSRRPRPKRPGASEATALPEQEPDTVDTEISAAAIAADDVPARGRGVLGFAVAIMLFVVLAVVYMIAPSLSAAVPPAAPVLDAYASSVDALRLSISDTYRGLTGGAAGPTSG